MYIIHGIIAISLKNNFIHWKTEGEILPHSSYNKKKGSSNNSDTFKIRDPKQCNALPNLLRNLKEVSRQTFKHRLDT